MTTTMPRAVPTILPVALLTVLLALLPALDPAARAADGPPALPAVAVGSFGWPLAGMALDAPPAGAVTVSRRFLPPPTPYGRGHRGLDLAAPVDTPVVAAGAGVVAWAGPLAGRGVVSVVHPGGLRTTYEPVDVVGVVVGTPVARGTVVGTLAPGHAGCPVAACLHWGLRWRAPADPDAARERYLDPLLLLGLGRTRLWP